MIELTDENFEKEIRESQKPVLVDFWAAWCPPCKMLTPVLEKVAQDSQGRLSLVKVNIDQAPLLAQKYGIEQIPTVVLFKKGRPVGGFIGFRPEALIKNWLEGLLKEDEN